MLKIDLHVHSYYSYDSLITPQELVSHARMRGLDGVAITDHDRLDGALKIAKEINFLVIPGIEISSRNGHVLALNVQEPIPKRLEVNETVERIHRAGGLAIACHPTTFFKGSLGKRVDSKFDAVEVINASAIPFHYSVRHARAMALRLGLAQVAGTDAHYAPEIGLAYTLIDADPNPEAILKSINKKLCKPFGNPIPWKMRLGKEFLNLKRIL